MGKHRTGIIIVVLVVITVWGMIIPASGQETAEQKITKESVGFNVDRVVVGTGVENNEPVGVAETFPVSVEKVYCFQEAADIAKDAKVSFVWYHGQDEMLKTTLPLKMGKRWRTFADKKLRGLKGDWKVEIKSADGNLLKEVKFKVD